MIKIKKTEFKKFIEIFEGLWDNATIGMISGFTVAIASFPGIDLLTKTLIAVAFAVFTTAIYSLFKLKNKYKH